MGLFTHALVSALDNVARERRIGLIGVMWYDVAERVAREVRRSKGGQWQLPVLWTAARGCLENESSPFLACAFPLAVEKDPDEFA